jgi:hypothetical protein
MIVLPAEKIILFGLLIASTFLLAGYPLLLPAVEGGAVLEKLTGTSNYLLILAATAFFYVALYVGRSVKEKQFSLKLVAWNSVILFRLLVATAVAAWLMLSFKWWSHLRGVSYDDFYQRIDIKLHSVLAFFHNTSQWMALPDDMYFYLFTLLFISAYIISMVLSPAWFARMLTANIAVMVIGGIAYMIAPAYGPFLYRDNAFFMETQAAMRAATDAFRASGGTVFDAGKFEYALGAMPSLHIAHALIIAVYAGMINRRLIVPYALILFYIIIHASVTGFHYLIDIPAGVLLTVLAFIVTEKLHTKPYLQSWDDSKR